MTVLPKSIKKKPRIGQERYHGRKQSISDPIELITPPRTRSILYQNRISLLVGMDRYSPRLGMGTSTRYERTDAGPCPEESPRELLCRVMTRRVWRSDVVSALDKCQLISAFDIVKRIYHV